MPSAHVLGQQVRAYSQWRKELITSLSNYQHWREQQELNNAEDDLRLYELIEHLKADKLTVALTAEYSRGKTELINAIFFSEHNQRLLPSGAGRTTMCPTEILYDPDQPPCIRLLPVETRTSALTIDEYKQLTTHWSKLPLDLENPRQVTEAFNEIIKAKPVSLREAEELGLYQPNTDTGSNLIHADGTIDIPVWRHAIINYPHPLLKQGLVVIDTPGLNALGLEPELALNVIPNALVVMFVLAADIGVSKSDYAIWKQICGCHTKPGHGHIAVLNKIDVLWDQLHDHAASKQQIWQQQAEVANILKMDRNQVYPVSAQKGLVAKIKNDHSLLERSGLLDLEIKLSAEIIPSKQQLVREKVIREISGIVDTTNTKILTRLETTNKQLRELRSLQGKNADAVRNMVEKIAVEKQSYDKTLSEFRATYALLDKQGKVLLDLLSIKNYDALVEKTRQEMRDSWTTAGLRVGMKTLFDGILQTTDKANKQAQHIKRMVQSMYNTFHLEYGTIKTKPSGFSVTPFRIELQRLQQEAEIYRKSALMIVSEQHFVIKRFFITLASRARVIMLDWLAATNAWIKAISQPLATQIHEHKLAMEQRINILNQIQQNQGSLEEQIQILEHAQRELENQFKMSQKILQKINQPLPMPGHQQDRHVAEKRLSV